MEFAVNQLENSVRYKLIAGGIVPRPIGWISTVSDQGVFNLAPYSFFNALSSTPALVAIGIGAGQNGMKDTLANLVATGEFVHNFVTEELGEAMNLTAGSFDSSVDEFELGSIATASSKTVTPLRVMHSPLCYECKVVSIQSCEELTGMTSNSHIVIGLVQHIYVADRVLSDNYKIDLSKAKPLGRLSGNSYSKQQDFLELIR